MALSRFLSPGMSVALVATLLLIVPPTLGCRLASRDANTVASDAPTWADLGARRLYLGDASAAAPDFSRVLDEWKTAGR